MLPQDALAALRALQDHVQERLFDVVRRAGIDTDYASLGSQDRCDGLNLFVEWGHGVHLLLC